MRMLAAPVASGLETSQHDHNFVVAGVVSQVM
jgi:hypothetical protein